MGLQAIWTHYGQAIFEQKLTTIANDLRIFTFNLFHHHVIDNLYKEYTEEMQAAKSRYRNWQTESDVKAGILMFLEDMVTWLFYLHDEDVDSNIDKLGVLGLYKARTLHNTKNETEIFLAANKRSGLLKNQINLGMTGRYKGPMMTMEFFDRSFSYIPKTWIHVDKFMKNWTGAMELEKDISKLVVHSLFKSTKKEFPQLTLSELKKNSKWKPIIQGYLNCFGKRKLPKEIRMYWQDKLGVSRGAPKALYDQITLKNHDDNFDPPSIFMKARRALQNEPGELEKINNIISIEPFLSHAEFLLRYISQQSIKRLEDIETDLAGLRAEIIKAGNFNIKDPLPRLMELKHVMLSNGTLEEWLKAVLVYHSKIMDNRGGTMWVNLEVDRHFKHYFGTPLRENLNSIAKYLKANFWWHTYYLETLRSIQSGLN